MKIIPTIKNVTRMTVVASAIALVAIINTPSAQALSLGGPTDCDANAVIYCGASSVSQLQNKYNNGVAKHNTASSIHNIYNYFGIGSGDINSMGSYAVAGEVYKDGNVKVNGKVVATGAMTAGRQNISGSTKITYGGTTFYKRSPSVSFTSNPLSAYVVMKNGKFQFAILASCGNPVSAHAVPTPTPTKRPTPIPTRKPTPTTQPRHSVCIQNACVSVPGAGYNTCSSSASCHVQPTPTPHHYACVNNACVQVSGTGYSTCTSNASCQPKPTATCTPTPYVSHVSPYSTK